MSALERIRSVISGEQRALSSAMERLGGSSIEIRDPSAATNSISPYAAMSKTMVSEWNADEAIRLAYYSNVFVYRCVQACATAIGGLAFRVGSDPEKPDIFDPKAPMAVLLSPPPGGPAPGVSARRLFAWTVAQYMITGKYAWEIEGTEPGGQGDIANLWPLVSCALHPKPSSGGNAYFTGYAYGKPSADKNKIVDMQPDQVFYGWRPSQHDFRQPESALMAARLGVSVAVMQDRYDFAFLRNDARPAAIVVHEAFNLDQERDAFIRAFRGDFRGPDNAGKALFIQSMGDGPGGVAGAIDVKTLGLSQRDGQFIARYEQKIAEICVALGTPMSILGDSSKRTYDAANVEHRNWWEGTLQPLCFEIADEINMQLAPRFGNEVGWFDFSQIKALQSDSRLLALGAILPLMVGSGLPIATSEFRSELGLPEERPDDPVNEAKLAAQKLANIPPALRPGATPSDLPVGDGKAPTDKPGVGTGDGPPAALPPGAPIGKLAAELVEIRGRTREVREVEWRAVDKKVASMEPIFADAITLVFKKQETSVLARLGGRRGRDLETRKDASKVFDKKHWAAETADAMRGQYAVIATAAGEAANAKIGTLYQNSTGDIYGYNVKDPQAQDFIDARANQLAGSVTDSTYDAIQNQMDEGAQAGESIPQIASRIQNVFDVATTSRAVMIARTEVIGAYNGATDQIANSLPSDVAAGEEWIAELDDHTRAAHEAADGQQVACGDPFSVDGEDLQYPGDPAGSPENVIQCRCTLGILTPAEFSGRSANKMETRFDLRGLRDGLWE
jgi:hypothetical protein